MKKSALSVALALLILGAAGYGWWGLEAEPAPLPDDAEQTVVAAAPAAPQARPTDAISTVDMAHFAFDDLLAAWRVPPPAPERPAQDPVRAAMRRPGVPNENVTDMLERWRNRDIAPLDVVAALSFCERLAVRSGADMPPEGQQRCAGLEPGDWIARSQALRALIDEGHVEARLMYQSVGPLGRVAMDDEIIATLGEERAQAWGREAADHLLQYVREGGALPFLAYGVLSDMHQIPESQIFGSQADPELAYAYAYLRAVSLIAQPPPMMPPQSAARAQEGSLTQLRRMEEELGAAQIAAARERAREIVLAQ